MRRRAFKTGLGPALALDEGEEAPGVRLGLAAPRRARRRRERLAAPVAALGEDVVRDGDGRARVVAQTFWAGHLELRVLRALQGRRAETGGRVARE